MSGCRAKKLIDYHSWLVIILFPTFSKHNSIHKLYRIYKFPLLHFSALLVVYIQLSSHVKLCFIQINKKINSSSVHRLYYGLLFYISIMFSIMFVFDKCVHISKFIPLLILFSWISCKRNYVCETPCPHHTFQCDLYLFPILLHSNKFLEAVGGWKASLIVITILNMSRLSPELLHVQSPSFVNFYMAP